MNEIVKQSTLKASSIGIMTNVHVHYGVEIDQKRL